MQIKISSEPGVVRFSILAQATHDGECVPATIELYRWPSEHHVGFWHAVYHMPGGDCPCPHRDEGICVPVDAQPIRASEYMRVWREAQEILGIEPLILLIGLLAQIGVRCTHAGLIDLGTTFERFTQMPVEKE